MKEGVSPGQGSTDLIPLIIVEGFLSTTGSTVWSPWRRYVGGYEKQLGERKVVIASVGPVSSLHDRACELYFTIKGGTVDYGEEHSKQFRHKRLGRHHSVGLYPEWSPSRPLHFLGHSIGGVTIIKLQHLLSIGYFGQETHPDMILSITTVSAPFRGTQIVYTLGEREDSAPAVRPLSIGSIVSKAVHVLSYLSPLLPQIFDLHADSRSLSYQESSFTTLLRHLWRSDWAEGRDATPFDVTFEASDERDANNEGVCNPRTYYRSYAAGITKRVSSDDPRHSPPLSRALFPPLYLAARAIGAFDFSTLRPPPSFLPQPNTPNPDPEASTSPLSRYDIDEHHWANDGLVPVFSQWHPQECVLTRCVHHEAHASLRTQALQSRIEPGVWNVYYLENTHHLSILPLWVGSTVQVEFWNDLGNTLNTIDSQRLYSGF